ncbi:MAG: amino acid permease [Acidimicrobiales bacterium]|nr:MAG: amino acid permease [Acidimicrobiales bacterium]
MSGPESHGSGASLAKTITAPLLLLLVVGDILGAGIYILVGEVAGELDGAAWLGFTLAFAIAAASAASYAELVTRFPGSAGSALYANEAFGRRGLTFVVGMAVMLSSLATAATTTRAFAGDYLAEFVDLPVVAVSLGLLAVLTVVSIRGIELSAKVNVGMTLVEIGGLVLVLVIGGAAIVDGGGDAGRITDFSSVGPDALLTATALAFFAFLGFEDAVHLSEEVPDVRRVFPRVLFGAVVIASVLYLAVVLVATTTVDPAVLAASDGPLLEVVSTGPLAISTRWFALVALVAVTNTSLFALVAASRLVYGMATDGSLPRPLARVHSSWRTPVTASLLVAALAAVLATTGAVEDLATAAVTLLLSVLVGVNAAAATTRSRPEAEAAYRAPRVVAPAAALAAATLLTHQLATSSAAEWLRLGALMLIVALAWLATKARPRASTGV